ncbi:MAG: O-antigen ligase family protein [Bacteroidetes bacterium]|nr:O-antigen ligase family protein [Bacteroidota bacterium]
MLTAGLILILIALLKPVILYLLLVSSFAIENFGAVPGVSYARIIGILLALALALRLLLRKETIPKDDSYKYFSLFFLGSIVSFAFASDISLSLTMYFTYISLFILYVATRYFLQSTDDINRALNVIFVSTLLSFMIVFALGLSVRGDGSVRISSGIGDPNEFASYILVLIPLALYSALNSSGILRISYWGCLISFLLLLVYTGSRGGILGFLGAIWILVYYYKGKMGRIFFLILSVATISFFLVPEDFWTRASTIMHSLEGKIEDESIEVRLESYQAALKMFLDYPLAGVGLRNFQFLSSEYGAIKMVVHNSYLEVLTGGGLLAFIPFSLILINSWRKLRLRKNYDKNIRDLVICLKASFVSILITSSFISAENKKILWFLFALISAVYYIAANQKILYKARNSQ